MNKSQWIATTAEHAGLTKKDTERVLNAALETITSALIAGEKVQISGFGTFEKKTRKARSGRNLSTGAAMAIPEAQVPAFQASQVLKDTVRKGK